MTESPKPPLSKLNLIGPGLISLPVGVLIVATLLWAKDFEASIGTTFLILTIFVPLMVIPTIASIFFARFTPYRNYWGIIFFLAFIWEFVVVVLFLIPPNFAWN